MNACGTIAIIHVVLISENAIIQEGSYLANFNKNS